MSNYSAISNATAAYARLIFGPEPASDFTYRGVTAPAKPIIDPSDNIVGLCTQLKTVYGKPTNRLAITFLVKEKLSSREVNGNSESAIPGSLPGYNPMTGEFDPEQSYLTDIEECGEIIPAASATGNRGIQHAQRVRPVPGGYSVGNRRAISAGTLAIWLRLRTKGMVGISNRHVLLPASGALGDEIVQPGRKDQRDGSGNVIGSLIDYVEFQPDENLIDVACFTPSSSRVVKDREIAGIGRISGLVTPARRMKVEKVGRTSGHTTGKITAIDAILKIRIYGREYKFTNQLKTDCALDQGDSGAALVEIGSKKICGICFAVNSNGAASYANNVRYVLGARSVLGWKLGA